MEDLPLGRIAALVPEFAVMDLPLYRRDNAKNITSYKDVILFSKIFYVFDVIYVKSNSISH